MRFRTPALLLLAAGLSLVANGANTIGLVAWLAPLFLLRFVRQQRPWLGLPMAFLLLAATFVIQFRAMVPMTGLAYFAFNAIFGLILVIPYYLPGSWRAFDRLDRNPSLPLGMGGDGLFNLVHDRRQLGLDCLFALRA
jgi:hypothetical protein